MLWTESKNRTRFFSKLSSFSFKKTTTTTTNSQKNIRAVEEIDVQSIVFKKDKASVLGWMEILDLDVCDVNKDGVVSLEEFSEAFKNFYLKKLRTVPENFVPGGKNILRIVKENLNKSSKKVAKPLFDFIDLDGNGTIQKHEADILLLPTALHRIYGDRELQKKLVPKLPNVFLSVMYLLFDKNDDGDITKDEIVKRVSGFLSSITRFLIELIDFATDVASQVLQEKPELAEM